jgi:hypothetical protein
LEGRIEELDKEIEEVMEELNPLKTERLILQNRLNTMLGKVPTPRGQHGNNPGPVKIGVLAVLQESGELMRRKEISAKIKESGYDITDNHLGTTLSNLKKSGEIINPETGYYGVPESVKNED